MKKYQSKIENVLKRMEKKKKGKSKLEEVGGNTFATIAKERDYAT